MSKELEKVILPIKRIRVEVDKTVEEFAEALNVSVSTVHNWESGQDMPDNRTLTKLEELITYVKDS